MFTDRLREIMQTNNITAYRIAKVTGISQGLMAEYHRGDKIPTVNNLIKIADYLGCSVDYLLGRTDNPLESLSKALNSPQSAGAVTLPSDAIKTAQEAAEAQGEGTVQFIERAISMQIERDKVQRIINKQSKKGGE